MRVFNIKRFFYLSQQLCSEIEDIDVIFLGTA